jgi:exodeoxyribonuclease VII large subunit
MEREHIYQVHEITGKIKAILESSFPRVAVEGEVSNFRAASSGHWYFTLKDEQSMIQAVMFKFRNSRVRFAPQDGQKVLVRGNIGVYAKRGNYQIICDTMEKAGEGDILAMLEERKRKLAEEGLFEEERKQPLPRFPGRIAVVTSSTGAALRDILQVLGRRSSGLDVVVLPAPVQGEEAAGRIAAQIRRAEMFSLGDVVIVGRGGGSLEDLLPFSDEEVVRAVAGCRLPVISAVGHEIDTALSDLAADVRAPTPSAAAELVSASREELAERVSRIREEMTSRVRDRLERAQLLVSQFTPENLERQFRQLIQPSLLRLDDAKEELIRSMTQVLQQKSHRVELLKQSLEANSPMTILDRGYAVVTRAGRNELITDAAQVEEDEGLDIRLKRGGLGARVTELRAGHSGASSAETPSETT